jgi:hypothetical protein
MSTRSSTNAAAQHRSGAENREQEEQSLTASARNRFTTTRSGQASIEYLMNYAWAIALIIIVVGAIINLDIVQLKFSIGGSGSSFGQSFETVAVQGHRLHNCGASTNCLMDLTLKNNGAERVNVTELEVLQLEGTDINSMVDIGDCTRSGTTIQTKNDAGKQDGDMPPGETMQCSDIEFDAQNVGAWEAGNPYSLRLRIQYNVTDFEANSLAKFEPEMTLTGKMES